MPRLAKSQVVIEKYDSDNDVWRKEKNGFGTIPEAEKWLTDNMEADQKYRVIRVSGIYELKYTISKT